MDDLSKRRWFLPDNPDLLGMLRVQSAITVEAMGALHAWSGGDTAAADRVRACEHRADDAKRELWLTLRDAYSPPLDAEDLYSLSADLDMVLNAAKDLVRETDVMDLEPDEATHEMVGFLVEAVGHLDTAIGRIGTDGDATEAADAAIESERRIEHSYRGAMSTLLTVDDLHEVMGWREIYRRLSRIADLIHVVAERIWYSEVKEA